MKNIYITEQYTRPLVDVSSSNRYASFPGVFKLSYFSISLHVTYHGTLLFRKQGKAGTTAKGQNLLANISTSTASLLQGQYNS